MMRLVFWNSKRTTARDDDRKRTTARDDDRKRTTARDDDKRTTARDDDCKSTTERDDAFDWRSLPAIEPEAFDGWFGCTDAKDRQLPFQIALQVHDELEEIMMAPGKMDSLALAEIRGGLKALSRYCKIYQSIIYGKKRNDS